MAKKKVEVIPRFNGGAGGVSIICKGALLSPDEAKALAIELLKAWDVACQCIRPELSPGHPWDWTVAIDSIEEWEANSRA